MASPQNLEILAHPDAVALRAVELLCSACEQTQGAIWISLSGGSTPQRLYRLLAEPSFSKRVPWQRVHLFWGDERFVPVEHADSNFRMVRETLLNKVPMAAINVHPMPTTGMSPAEAAVWYERELHRLGGDERVASNRPLFDITLLGVGDDGHTASLFPGVQAIHERKQWTAAVIGAKPEARLTLTFPALNSSALVMVLATGTGKRAVLARLASGEDLPIAHVAPVGRMVWLLDEAAGACSG